MKHESASDKEARILAEHQDEDREFERRRNEWLQDREQEDEALVR